MRKLVLSALSIVLLFAACKKSEDSPSVIGKWYLDNTETRITSDGTKLSDTTVVAIPSGQYLEFTKDSFLHEYLYDTATSSFYTDTFKCGIIANEIITSKPETMMMQSLTSSNLQLYTQWQSSNGTATVFTEKYINLHR